MDHLWMIRTKASVVHLVQRPTIHAAHEQAEIPATFIANVTIAGDEAHQRDGITLLQFVWKVAWSHVAHPCPHFGSRCDVEDTHGGMRTRIPAECTTEMKTQIVA